MSLQNGNALNAPRQLLWHSAHSPSWIWRPLNFHQFEGIWRPQFWGFIWGNPVAHTPTTYIWHFCASNFTFLGNTPRLHYDGMFSKNTKQLSEIFWYLMLCMISCLSKFIVKLELLNIPLVKWAKQAPLVVEDNVSPWENKHKTIKIWDEHLQFCISWLNILMQTPQICTFHWC